MKEWLNHIHHSPYCYRRYPGLLTSNDREACPCGWVSKHSASEAGVHEWWEYELYEIDRSYYYDMISDPEDNPEDDYQDTDPFWHDGS